MVVAIAHRGDPVGHRENTMEAFAAALAAGADMVELDLRRTRDGQVVVVHDATLTRLWGIDRAVAELDLAQLPRRTAPSIPTLAEVLDAFEAPLMVDFTTADVVEGAWRVVRAAGAVDRSLFVSGNLSALRQLRELAPAARIGLTWGTDGDPPTALLAELEAEYWNPRHPLVSPERVGLVHRAGYRVSTWTVDQVDELHRVLAAGVDAVVTNRMDRLRAALGPGHWVGADG